MSDKKIENYTEVFASGNLGNGRFFSFAWTTTLTLGRAAAGAHGWVIRELRKRKVRGRSRITNIKIEVSRLRLVYPAPKEGDQK